MNCGYRYLSTLLLTTALLGAGATAASAAPQVVVRFYDRDHRDYHDWNDREARSYEQYRVDHPRVNVRFEKAGRRNQKEYWTWRHNHPDHD